MEKILTMLVGLLIALGGWSLSRTFELSTIQAVHENQVDKLKQWSLLYREYIIGFVIGVIVGAILV